MPNRDGTGPLGRGPLTGRGFGPCGRGLRRGFGCAPVPVPLSKEEQIRVLEEQKKDIEARLRELKGNAKA